MRKWVAQYVKGCMICQQSKPINHPCKTPLYHIPVPSNALPFQVVAMDLITQLPESAGYNAILTIVDHGCSRAAVFLPCKTHVTGEGIATLYLKNVYPWFGIPAKIITDQDPHFMSHFTKALSAQLGIQQNISTVYHPQTNGLLERKNQWVEQFLHEQSRAVVSVAPDRDCHPQPSGQLVNQNKPNRDDLRVQTPFGLLVVPGHSEPYSQSL